MEEEEEAKEKEDSQIYTQTYYLAYHGETIFTPYPFTY